MWTSLVLGLLVIFMLDYFWRLYKHVRVAQRIGLPYVVSPFSFTIVTTILFSTDWVPYIVNHYLPLPIADRVRDTMQNLRWTTKDRQVKRFGKVYLLVTPGTVICNVADADVVTQIVNARGSFPKPIWQYKVIELYGPNVITCEDVQWARHRRQTAMIFNEKNNDLVWKESIRLAKEMIEQWQESSAVDIPDAFIVDNTRDDMLKFALSVFSGAGFGVKIPFKPVNQDASQGPYGIFQDTKVPPKSFNFTFRSVVAYMNLNVGTVVFANLILPQWIPRSLFPFLKRDFAAHRDLKSYLKRLLDTSDMDRDKATTSNLVEGMLKARKTGELGSSNEKVLTDLEIISNSHIFTIAGHDTAATTLRYAFLLLALHQDVQAWLYEGIREATKGEPSDVADWDYASVYPKLITPLCVMLETMRLYPPVVTVPKWTGDSARSIHFQGKNVTLEPGVNIGLNMNGLHYSEEYWGKDAGLFHPQRWDARNKESYLAKNTETSGLGAPGLEYPTIHKPVRGAYIPFSDGYRACMGKKFAQIEVVIALAVIFLQYRAELTVDNVRNRKWAERVLEESATIVTLAMKEDIPLVFKKR